MTAKRLTALLLVLVMLFSCMLTGCGRKESTGRNNNTNTNKREDIALPGRPSANREMKPEDIAEYLQTRVVKIETDESIGSGFFIDDEGTLVTNYHVIEGAESIDIIMNDGATYAVKTIVDFSPFHDVAVLKADISGNDYLTISYEYKQGAAVYAMGAPKNMDATFTSGSLSATSRQMGLMDCIQIDAAINPGNSGGPTVNSKGEVLGINTMIRTDAQNIAFAVKMSVLDELGMDKNYTINRYCEWYNKEVGRSYMCTEDGRTFGDTYVNTYTAVTGVDCLASSDDLEDFEDGYSIMYLFYAYEYDMENYDKYCDYLNSIGFEYVGAAREMGMEGAEYIHTLEGYSMALLHETTTDLLIISCPIY